MEATVKHSVFEILKNNPFFFLKLKKSCDYDDRGRPYDTSEYVSVDPEIGITIKPIDIEGRHQDIHRNYHLCLADFQDSTVTQNNPDYVDLHFHKVSLRNLDDATHVLKMYLKHLDEKEHRYAYLELLWLLNDGNWTDYDIKKVIRGFNPNSIPKLCKAMSDVGRCLSIKKQRQLHNALSEFGFNYSIYSPGIIQGALSKLGVESPHDQSDNNLYQAVDLIMKTEPLNVANTDGNLLLELKEWLQSDNSYSDYRRLINVFSLVNEPTRLCIVKRWFHDIRLGNTSFDPALLEQFKDNQYDEFIKYRYCTESPSEPIVLTVPLLCDNILTLYHSGGSQLLSFDGVLDFAITHCDTAHPDIDLRMDRIIPKCDGGAQINRSFNGFISYKLIIKLDEESLSEENVLAFIKQRIEEYGTRKSYFVCKFGDGTPLNEEQTRHCHSRHISGHADMPDQGQRTGKYDCCESRFFEDRWIITNSEKIELIKNKFLKEGVGFTLNGKLEVNVNMISIDRFTEYIRQLPRLENFETVGEAEYLLPPYLRDVLNSQIVDNFYTIERMRIIPNNNVVAGLGFDLFGIRNRLIEDHPHTPEMLSDDDKLEISNEHERLESKKVHDLVVDSLSANYNMGEFSAEGNYFETDYNAELLNEIKLRYYYKRNVQETDTLDTRSFLRSARPLQRIHFCSPKLAETRSTVLDLPFFWCYQGRECYHNCLGHQTLSAMNDWRHYTLFHLIEIIGFPKIQQTEAENEPDEVIRRFVAVTYKVMQKYRRLKCRGCGHLMFTAQRGNGNFNQHNFFACANPNCSEYNHRVYLNHCFRCGRGLIDSRDQKKCPNGWYICPECQSCCNNELFENIAQRYIVVNRPVPPRIQQLRGQGHAEQNMRFCPKCGTLLTNYHDDHGDNHFGCPQCHEDFEQTNNRNNE